MEKMLKGLVYCFMKFGILYYGTLPQFANSSDNRRDVEAAANSMTEKQIETLKNDYSIHIKGKSKTFGFSMKEEKIYVFPTLY